MKFSEHWLREWVNPPVSTEELAEQLTMAGLEVEAVEDCSRNLAGVVIAGILESSRHPDADNLVICKVDAGTDAAVTVVCGAPNVQPGKMYALAPAGSILEDGTVIRETMIKGAQSSGMLCSGSELGLTDDAGSLMEFDQDIKPGTPLETYLNLKDRVIELSLTPNRGDCLSIAGIAREVGVLYRINTQRPAIESVPAVTDRTRDIFLDAPQACACYAGRVIEGIDPEARTPVWMSEKLRRSGIRSINIVVDVTNYIMLELGQPMHAFDHDLVSGNIHVRYASDGEKLSLLDGSVCELTGQTLVIADESRAVALAGIMGGLDTAVTSATRNIFLESAWFNPEVILGRARAYGLHTDSSHRFERGVDYQLQSLAMERATGLILELCGGRPGPVIAVTSNDHLPKRLPLQLRHERLNRLLGVSIGAQDVTEILQRLELKVEETDAGWEIIAPAFRFDIAIETDLIEEITRIYGYDRIPLAGLTPQVHIRGMETRINSNTLRHILQQRGYHEVISYSFVDRKLQSRLLGSDNAIALLNPISAELNVMRKSLLPSLLSTLVYNLKRQQPRVRLFELGHIYQYNGKILEESVASGMCYGNLYPEQWDMDDTSCDFFDVKADVEALIFTLDPGVRPEYRQFVHPSLHPGRSAQIIFNNQLIGYIGAIHPAILKELDIPQTAYFFELKMSAFSAKITPKYKKLSKFPSIRRDLAIVLDRQIPALEVMKCVRSAGSALLENLELFDLYIGEGIDIEKKSLALGLTFRGTSSTLIDTEVDDLVSSILRALQSQFGATLRE